MESHKLSRVYKNATYEIVFEGLSSKKVDVDEKVHETNEYKKSI